MLRRREEWNGMSMQTRDKENKEAIDKKGKREEKGRMLIRKIRERG